MTRRPELEALLRAMRGPDRQAAIAAVNLVLERGWGRETMGEFSEEKALAVLAALYKATLRAFPQRSRTKEFRSNAVPGWRYFPAEHRVVREQDDDGGK